MKEHLRTERSGRFKMKGISISEFYEKMKDELQLALVAGREGLGRRIMWAEINRPGLALAGYFDYFAWRRVQILGKVEVTYLRSLKPRVSRARIREILSRKIPCMLVARRYRVPQELLEEGDRLKVPVFRSTLVTVDLIDRVTVFLDNEFAPSVSLKRARMKRVPPNPIPMPSPSRMDLKIEFREANSSARPRIMQFTTMRGMNIPSALYTSG